MRNAEGKMRNGMCGATVIGRDVTSRDCIYSAFHHAVRQLRGGKLQVRLPNGPPRIFIPIF